jgi:hypothetical protein
MNSSKVLTILSYKFQHLIDPAIKYNIKSFPKVLNSLSVKQPTSEDIENDIRIINSFYNHPLLIKHFPTYEEFNNYYLFSASTKNTNKLITK